jgi:hypothetical protein
MTACAVAIKKKDAGIGDHVEVTADVTLSATYTTGGDTVPIAALGLKTLRSLVLCAAHSAVAAGMRPVGVVHGATEVVDPKLMVGVAATGVEETGGTNLSTHTVRVVAKGDHAFA